MSHFSLAVLHRDPDGLHIDELLAPFDEATRNPEYLTFHDDEEGEADEATGKRGHYCNDRAKYDWYAAGGRWRGQLKLKPGTKGRYAYPSTDPARPDDQTRCDTARIRDIDFAPSEEAYRRALLEWDYCVEGKPWTDKAHEPPLSFVKPEYYRKQYGDKETFAKWSSEFSTYAYLTEDGEWHEPGHMGWFAMTDETRESKAAYNEAFKRDVINADPELYLTILDCHI